MVDAGNLHREQGGGEPIVRRTGTLPRLSGWPPDPRWASTQQGGERSPPAREAGERRSREPLLLYNCNFCLILSEINLEA
jgi:hypothetical protein